MRNDEWKIWPYSGVFFFFWLASNILVPYLGIFYEEKGFSDGQIGILSGIFQFTTVVAAFLGGWIVDYFKKSGKFITLLVVGMILSSGLLYIGRSMLFTGCVVVLFSFCYAPVNGITDKAVMERVKERQELYSLARSKGTLGAGIGIIIAALLIEQADYFPIIMGFVLAILPCVFFSQYFVNKKTIETVLSFADIKSILKNRYLFAIYGGIAIWGMAESGVGVFQALLIQNAGYSIKLTSLFIAVAMIGEYIGFLVLPWLKKCFLLSKILVIAFALQALRIWSLGSIGIIPVKWIVFFQFTGGASFALMYSVMTILIDRQFEEKMLYIAHSLKAVMNNGVGNALGLLLLGCLFGRGNERIAYWFIATGPVLMIFYLILGYDMFDEGRHKYGN